MTKKASFWDRPLGQVVLALGLVVWIAFLIVLHFAAQFAVLVVLVYVFNVDPNFR